MSKRSKQRCSCGSSKGFRQCCGKAWNETKLELERAAKRFSDFGMHAEACDALAKRASLSPENPMIWNDLGVQLVAAGRAPDALAAFRKAHDILPEYPIALYNLGKVLLDRCLDLHVRRTKEQDDRFHELATEAAKFLRASVAHDPSLVCAHELLHKLFGVLGDQQKAGFHLSQALRLNPELRTLYDRPRLERLPVIGRMFIKSHYLGPDFLSSR